ncbi:MAG: hypothetical protein FWG84_02440 [Bacteroidales bacterium]|nr:hypothetical protein [Bacteroidales bacterium]
MKTRILFITLIFSFLTAKTQDIPIGQWRVHVPYNRAIGVKVVGDDVYCLTTRGLFVYDRKSGYVETISKLDGLSGNVFSALGYNESQKCIIIGHEDGSIDLIKNNEIVNVADIKNSDVSVKKINRIVCYGKYAYLCGEFGVVVYDLENEGVKDTYRMRMDGTEVAVWDFTADDKNFYAATNQGIFYAAQNEPLISHYNAWTQMETPEYGRCVAINYWKGKLVYYFEETFNVYTQTPLKNDYALLRGYVYAVASPYKPDISISNDQLLISAQLTVYVYPESYQSSKIIRDVHVGDTIHRVHPMQAFYAGNNQYFVADYGLGLLFINDMETIAGESIQPNGPYSYRSFNMTTDGTKVWVASGGHDEYMAPASWTWKEDNGLYCFDGYSWTSFNHTNKNLPDNIKDVANITVHPQNKDLLYIGTWGTGMAEMTNGVVTKVYNSTNSPLQKRFEAPGQGEFVAGIAFDSKGLMWVANSNARNLLLTLDKSGTWESHYLGNNCTNREVYNLVIDSYDNKWLVDRQRLLIVYNEKNGGKVRLIGPVEGLDARPRSIAEDKNGNMWVGTDAGIFIIRNLYNILESNNGNFYPLNIDRPKLTLGGFVDYLLNNERITQIIVNGSNEKWCFSDKQGVYKISADGMEEIFHFTADKLSTGEKSPIFSDNMLNACITDNGEVFMATEHGIVSYRDEATKGTSTNGDVYAFPNPVKPDYQGPIAISGVVDMADIKITDVAGNLVYATQAKGGQAIWYAKDFNGKRVKTGVYVVFITDEDGIETTITKIMVLN